MESKVIHSRVHEYEELHPHDDEHDENKSVLKKVKAKAKKIKEKIKNHGHHDDHDLDEEEEDDEPEVHGAPIYESSLNRGSVVGGEEEPRVVVVNLEKPTGLVEDPVAHRSSLHTHTTASDYHTKLTHPTQPGVFPLPGAAEADIEALETSFTTMNVHHDEPKPKPKLSTPNLPSETKPRTGIHDPNVLEPTTTSSYQTKLTHPPHQLGVSPLPDATETDIESLQTSFATMNVSPSLPSESKPLQIYDQNVTYPSSTTTTHYEPIPKPPTFSSAAENVVVPSTTIPTHQDYKSTDIDANLDDFSSSFGVNPIQKPPLSTSYDDPIFPVDENVFAPITRTTTHEDYKTGDANVNDFSKSSYLSGGNPISTSYDDPIFPADENVVPPTTRTTTHDYKSADIDANLDDFSKSSTTSSFGVNPIQKPPLSTNYDDPIFPAAENVTHEDYKTTNDANVNDFSKSSYLSGGNPKGEHYEPIQNLPNPTNLGYGNDKVTTSTTTKDHKNEDFDADADVNVNVNYYSKSSSLGENPIQKQPNPTKDHMTEDADDNVIASTKLSSSGATPTEYGKKIAESVTEKLAPFYGKVAGLGDAVKCKVVSNSSNVGGDNGGNNNGVSMKDYLVEKLRPGDEDKALSEVISEVLHNKQNEQEGTAERETEKKNRVVLGKVTESEEVKRRFGSDDDDNEGEKSDNWMVDKIKGVVGSWFGKPDQENQSSKAVETTEGLSKNYGEGGEAVSYERRLQESSN